MRVILLAGAGCATAFGNTVHFVLWGGLHVQSAAGFSPLARTTSNPRQAD
jgi:hypothetical protein